MKNIMTLIVLIVSVFMLSGQPLAEAEMPEPSSEPEIIDRIKYWDEHPEEDPRPLLGEAYAAARVADAVCPNGSKEIKSAIIQCVYNRSLAVGFPNTIEEVVNQPYQWEGLTHDLQPDEETRRLAKELITQWRNGDGYVIYLDNVFMTKEIDGLHFRSIWNGKTERIVPYER